MKVLVVDDSRAMRLMILRTLQKAHLGDLVVVEAEDGAAGLEAVQEHLPDLVLSDWNMPKMNGMDFLKSLRNEGRNVPFGFVTSECGPETKIKARAAGASFVIAKPFTPFDVEAAVGAFVA